MPIIVFIKFNQVKIKTQLYIIKLIINHAILNKSLLNQDTRNEIRKIKTIFPPSLKLKALLLEAGSQIMNKILLYTSSLNVKDSYSKAVSYSKSHDC